MTPKDMLATWSDDATQQKLPFSIGRASRTRAQVEATLPKLAQILTYYTVSLLINPNAYPSSERLDLPHAKLTVYNVVHDAAKGKAVIYAITRADTPFGMERTNEYACFVTLEE